MKKLISVLLTLVMVLSFGGMAVSAKSEVKLSKTSVSLQVGETTKIKLNGASGNVVWGTTDKSVCKYVKGGYIKAVGTGSAYIYAKNNGYKYKCKVTVSGSGSISVSESKVTVSKGGLKTVKVTTAGVNKLKYKITNSDVCSVSATALGKGEYSFKIKGKKAGKASIKIYDSSDSSVYKKISVTVSQGSTITVSMNFEEYNYYYDDGDDSDDYDTDYGEGLDSRQTETVSVADFIDEVIRLVNEERTALGLAELAKDDVLCENAEVRVKELGKKFSHTRPDGTSCFTAVTAECSGYMAENIAMGQTTPEDVMRSWMNSEGHRENILCKQYTRIGVGYDPDTNAWVQLFVG